MVFLDGRLGMNGLVHDTHQKKLALEVHNEAPGMIQQLVIENWHCQALIHLTLSMEADCVVKACKSM